MCSIEAVTVTKVDISAMVQQQFYYFFETKSSSIVQSCQTSFIANGCIGSVI